MSHLKMKYNSEVINQERWLTVNGMELTQGQSKEMKIVHSQKKGH